MLRAGRRPDSAGAAVDGPLPSNANFEPSPDLAAQAARPPASEVDAGVPESPAASVAAQTFARSVPVPAPGPAPMTMPVRTWQPARQGSRDRPPVREQPEVDPNAEPALPAIERVATAPQLRRFIKSRAYVPMHELRRRFAINGGDDDVTQVELERTHVYVGLPEREGRLLGELLRGGDIGYELSLDPITPIVVGVYPMRPVTRG